MFDLLLTGGSVVTESGLQEADVAVKDGRVAALCARGTVAADEAARVIDCAGRIVSPGVVDPHAHLGIYQPYPEDYARDTAAAAVGGVTTVVNYLKSNEDYPQLLETVIPQAQSHSVIDFALSLMLVRQAHLDQVPAIVGDFGVTSFKFLSQHKSVYAATSGVADALALDDWSFGLTLQALNEVDVATTLCMHCENMELARPLTALAKRSGGTLQSFEKSSPGFAETSDLLRFAHLAKVYGGHIYAVHLSAASSVAELPLIQELLDGSAGRLSVETTPHYLTLTSGNPHGTLGKVGPPLRQPDDNDALWSGLMAGQVHTIGSDHVPSMLPVRQVDGDGVWETKLGFGGIGLMLPLVLEFGYHQRGLPLERLLGALTWETARRFGLDPRKGSLTVGADADIVVIDLDHEETVTAGTASVGLDHTPYEGMTLRGWPVLTVSRGEVIAESGRCVVEPGRGRYLERH